MISDAVARVVGMPLGLCLGLGAVALITTATPTRDFTANLPTEHVILADGQADTVRGVAYEGVDLTRVTADLDGLPVPLQWQGSAFEAQLLAQSPGAHALRLGVVHQGNVRRQLVLPVVAGPFAARDAWLDGALTVQLGMNDLDANGARADDLMSALSRYLEENGPNDSPLGAIERCTLHLRGDDDTPNLLLGGDIGFTRGALAFMIPMRVRRPTRNSLSLERAGRIQVNPDERALDVGRAPAGALGGAAGAAAAGWLFGPIGALIGGALGGIAGQEYGGSQVREQARTTLERYVDALLPRAAQFLTLPEELALAPTLPGTRLRLRFQAPPRFREGRGLVVVLDAQLEGPPAQGLPGPLAFSDAAPLPASDRSALRVSPALVAALVEAYNGSGAADMALAHLATDEHGQPRQFGPLTLRRAQLALPLLVEPGAAPNTMRWSAPDVALTSNLPLDLHVFARGALALRLAPDGRSVLAQPSTQTTLVSCRSLAATGWDHKPCLSDAMNAIPDIPGRLSRGLPEIPLFADILTPLADQPLRAGELFTLQLTPTSLQTGDARGAPQLTLSADLRFQSMGAGRWR